MGLHLSYSLQEAAREFQRSRKAQAAVKARQVKLLQMFGPSPFHLQAIVRMEPSVGQQVQNPFLVAYNQACDLFREQNYDKCIRNALTLLNNRELPSYAQLPTFILLADAHIELKNQSEAEASSNRHTFITCANHRRITATGQTSSGEWLPALGHPLYSSNTENGSASSECVWVIAHTRFSILTSKPSTVLVSSSTSRSTTSASPKHSCS